MNPTIDFVIGVPPGKEQAGNEKKGFGVRYSRKFIHHIRDCRDCLYSSYSFSGFYFFYRFFSVSTVSTTTY